MKSTIVLIFIAAALCSAAEQKQGEAFTVKKLKSADVAGIATANAEMEAIAVRLEALQLEFEAAQKKRDAITQAISESVGAFEGTCQQATVNSLIYGGQRHFRRVEIRGGYALVTTGVSSCGLGITGTGTLTTLSSSTLSNDAVVVQPK